MQIDAQTQEFQNRNTAPKTEKPEFYLDDERLEQLKDLCVSLDPYRELSLDDKLKLSEFGIKEYNDPFSITNQLLMILENNLQYREMND